LKIMNNVAKNNLQRKLFLKTEKKTLFEYLQITLRPMKNKTVTLESIK